VRAVAVSLLLLSVAAGALLLGPLHPEALLYRLVEFEPSNPWSWGPRWAATARRWWGSRCDRVVAGTLPVACVGLYHSLYAAWLQNRHVSNSWIIGLLTMFATNGMRFARVLVAIGLAHSCRSAYHQCQHLSKRALTRWGTRILSARA